MIRVTLIAVAGALAIAPPALASPRTLRLDPAATRVEFVLPATGHSVEGVLALESGVVSFDGDTGAASGAITVDLRQAVTGNDRRDRTMHDEVLETGRWPVATFRPSRLVGSLPPQGTSTISLEGVLSVHGGDHPMTLPATVTTAGDRLTADVQFPVPFVDWGMEDPSFFFLRVAPTVYVRVHAKGSLSR